MTSKNFGMISKEVTIIDFTAKIWRSYNSRFYHYFLGMTSKEVTIVDFTTKIWVWLPKILQYGTEAFEYRHIEVGILDLCELFWVKQIDS